MSTQEKRGAGQEKLLLDYVQRLDKHKQGRRAVDVHLSDLKPYNRREHHIRIASNSFDTLIKKLQGQLFVLGSSDLFFIFKKEVLTDVETILQRLRFLFGDDPLLADAEPGQDKFTTWYNVASQYDLILQKAKDLAIEGRRREAEMRAAEEAKRSMSFKASAGEPLTPEVLARVEQALVRADLSNMLRRQYVCEVAEGDKPISVFSEMFISIADLREAMLPNVNLASNRWLFQHMTESLDRRILSLLSKTDVMTLSGDLSFNLNVRTLLSPEFMAFDDAVPAGRRGTMVLELQKVDIFADLGAYLFARDFVQERGYRICVDGLTYQTLPFIDRERLGADLLKLIWHPELMLSEREQTESLTAEVRRQGADSLIICRCDGREAIDFGKAIGVKMFQGRFIENLIADENRKKQLYSARSRRR